MTYLIDGHNLIPNIDGLSLDQLDDEEELVSLLVNFSNRRNCQIEVYFDHGQIVRDREYRRSRVHVHFVLPPMIADSAILGRLLGIGRAAKNYIIVTSDQNVQNRARAIGATVLTSQKFAQLLDKTEKEKGTGLQGVKPADTEKEVDEWMKLFSKGKSDKPKT